MLADLHLHTARCGHARGEIAEYVAHARGVGVSEIAFSDHLPLVDRHCPDLTMDRDELPAYVADVQAARSDTGPDGPRVLLGIEADWLEGTEDAVREMLAAHPFDVVLGSVHFLGDWPFDHPDHRERYEDLDPDDFWAEYLETLGRAARSGLFDVLAHPDLAKKFDVRPRRDPREMYHAAAETAAAAGLAVEINTAGLFKPVGEMYPSRDFLHACVARRVPITLGSDAHAPEQVGREFAQAVALAREVGYREAMTFESRRPRPYRLPEA